MRRAEAIAILILLREPLRKLGVLRLDLIGSVARDEASEDSDVDVLIELAPGPDKLGRHFAIQDALEQALGRRVDVVLTSTVRPLAWRVIEQERVHVA